MLTLDRVTTYINNLRPDKHAELYHLIEQVISILQGLLDNGLKVDQAI